MASRQRTPRLAPAARRRQIIDATLSVAAVNGFGSLTLDAIAHEAGITRPVIYDLFGDLSGLLAATLADAERRALTTVQGVLPEPRGELAPAIVLAQALELFLQAVRRDPLTWRLILLPTQGAPAAIRANVQQNRTALIERVSVLVSWGLDRIGAPAEIERRVLARLLIATGEEMARLVLEHPRRYTPARVARSVQAIARLLPEGELAGAPEADAPEADEL